MKYKINKKINKMEKTRFKMPCGIILNFCCKIILEVLSINNFNNNNNNNQTHRLMILFIFSHFYVTFLLIFYAFSLNNGMWI